MDKEETSLRPAQKPSQRLGEQDVLIVEMMQTEKDKKYKQAARGKWRTIQMARSVRLQ